MDVQLYDEIMSFKRTGSFQASDHHPLPLALWLIGFITPTTSRRRSWGPQSRPGLLSHPQGAISTARFKDKIFFLKSNCSRRIEV